MQLFFRGKHGLRYGLWVVHPTTTVKTTMTSRNMVTTLQLTGLSRHTALIFFSNNAVDLVYSAHFYLEHQCSLDTFQTRFSANQCHVTISLTQVTCFVKSTASQVPLFD